MEAGWLTDLTVLQGITFEQAQGESFALFYFPSGIQPFMAYLCRQILSRGAREKTASCRSGSFHGQAVFGLTPDVLRPGINII
jgi:hypothetical protein